MGFIFTLKKKRNEFFNPAEEEREANSAQGLIESFKTKDTNIPGF